MELNNNYNITKILSAIGNILNDNATIKAIHDKYNKYELEYIKKFHFI